MLYFLYTKKNIYIYIAGCGAVTVYMGIQEQSRLLLDCFIDWKCVKGISKCLFYGAHIEVTEKNIEGVKSS